VLVAGVDEAGRGCVIGPLVIAGVMISEENLIFLSKLGVKDSKLLSPKKREALFAEIFDLMEKCHVVKLLPSVIDRAVENRHKADKIYPVVSAASIVAKVERDREIAALRVAYGDFGSGYLADQKTTLFLKRWLQTHEEYPSCVRKSWKPAKQAKNEKGTVQKKLA
jgi:ribonuclease HII